MILDPIRQSLNQFARPRFACPGARVLGLERVQPRPRVESVLLNPDLVMIGVVTAMLQ